jgi:hypothetical protein
MNPTVDKDFILRRAATKIVLAAERLGRMSATGTQAVLHCNGKVMYKSGVLKPTTEYVN